MRRPGRRSLRCSFVCLCILGAALIAPVKAHAEAALDLQCIDATAEALIRLGEYQKARADLETRLRVADAGAAETLPLQASMVQVLLGLNDYGAARALNQSLGSGSRALGNVACQVRSLWADTLLATQQGDVATARQASQQGLAMLGPAGATTRLAARLHRARGNAERWAGDFRAAIAAQSTALTIWRALGDEWGEAGEEVNLSISYEELGEIGRAIDLVEHARETLQRLGDRSVLAAAMQNLGSLYLVLGQNERASRWTSAALDLHRQLGDPYGQAIDQLNLGKIAASAGRLVDAEVAFTEASALLAPDIYWRERVSILTGLADIAMRRGKYVEAVQSAEQCLALASARGYAHVEAACELRLGQAFFERGQQESGIAHVGRALLIAEQLQALDLVWAAGNTLRRQLSGIDRVPEAIFFGKLAVNTLQRLRQGSASLPDSDQQSLFEDRRRTHAQLADLLIGAGRIAEAQQVLTLMKRQELFDYLRGDSRLPIAERRLDYIGQETGWLGGYRRLIDPLSNESQGNSGEDFLAFVRDLKSDGSSVRKPAKPESASSNEKLWAERLKQAERGTVLVQYLVTEKRLRILLTTSKEQRVRTVDITSQDLNSQVSLFLQAVSDPASDPLPSAQAAYRLLIEPVAEDLRRMKARTLWLSLDGVLRYVPFAALHDGQGWLMQRYATAVMSEALGPPKPTRIAEGPHLAGLGMSKAVGDFEALTYVPRELAAIVRPVIATRPQTGVLPGKILLDEQFSNAALATTLGEDYPLVHIATHFSLSPGSDADSFLLLGDRTRLSVRNFREASYRLDNVDLLTLSACQTALNGSGSELEGFAAVAQLKGAHAVMASLWSVSDAGTEVLMRRFYQELLAAGMDRALALAKSQRSLLMPATAVGQSTQSAGRQLLAHPYIWAPFVLMGTPK